MARSRTRVLGLGVSALLLTALAGCSCSDTTPVDLIDTGIGPDGGGDGGPPRDTGPRPDATGDGGPMVDSGARCGNGDQETGEECDDGNRFSDDGCDADCLLECGDGEVTGTEACDTAIASGTGSCPTSCDDSMACTSDTLTGSECAATCVNTPITGPAPADGCCPPGEDSTTDNDCTAVCGNMIVETGETCDTGIASGAGSCPATCNDGIACTTDAAIGTACTAACTNTPITTAAAGDMCCPAGATPATDADCMGCGDGVVVAPETCDTAIATGTGSCPTACNDSMVCTLDTLVGGGTCSAACMNTPIAAGAADGCCPSGATMATDPDCTGRCGDGTITPPETCDDMNMTSGDGCSSTCQREPRAFRITTMTVQDPHLYYSILDVTGMVNTLIRDALTMDADDPPDSPADGFVDFSPIVYFHPFDQASGARTALDVDFADCTMPLASTVCTGSGMATPTDVTNSSGGMTPCLAPIAGTFPGGRGINSPAPACFASDVEATLTVSLGGVIIPLRNAQIGAQYVGAAPAGSLATGLIMGFLTEADAMAAVIPTTVSVVGGMPISALLRSGDRDMLTIGGVATRGWWFYLNYSATRVTYTP